MARKLAFIGFSYFFGLLVASCLSLWLTITISGLFLCISLCIFLILRPKHSQRLYRVGVCAAACCAGLMLYSIYDIGICRPIIADDGKAMSGEITITAVSSVTDEKAFYIGRCRLPCGRTGKIGFYCDAPNLVKGDTVKLSGTLYSPENTPFFNSRDYYYSKSVFLMLDVTDTHSIHIRENNPFRIASSLRERVISVIRRWIPSDEGELIIGMVFGNAHWRLSDKSQSSLYSSGIGHIAAVSGMHMAIAASVAAAIATAFGCPKRFKFLFALAAASAFALTAGFTASVVRSLIMITMVYAAEGFLEEYDPLSSLGAALILMTITAPFSVRDTSLLLSVSGVVGTSVIAPEIIHAIETYIAEKYRLVYFRLNGGITASINALCASLAVFPAAAVSFDEISVVSPLTNLLLSPLCSCAVGISMAGSLLSLLPTSALSGGLFLASGIICKAVLDVSDFMGSLSFAAIPTELDITTPMLVIIILACGAAAVILSDRLYVMLTFVSTVFIAVITISAYSLIPMQYPEIAVLTEGNGCIIIVKDNASSQIYDFMGTVKGISAAESYLKRTGSADPAMIMLSEKCSSSYALYRDKFPSAQVISSNSSDGLTYSAEDNIIKFGAYSVYPFDGYTVVEAEGTRIICINKKCSLPDEKYDLAVINCKAAVKIDAESFAITDKQFAGTLSPEADSIWCSCCEYMIKGGEITPKEELEWLR